MYRAAEKGDIQRLAELLATETGQACINGDNGYVVSPVTHSPETPLTIAAIKGYVKVANYLLSKGASKEKSIECSDHEKPLVTGFFHELERISRFRPKLESKLQLLTRASLMGRTVREQ